MQEKCTASVSKSLRSVKVPILRGRIYISLLYWRTVKTEHRQSADASDSHSGIDLPGSNLGREHVMTEVKVFSSVPPGKCYETGDDHLPNPYLFTIHDNLPIIFHGLYHFVPVAI